MIQEQSSSATSTLQPGPSTALAEFVARLRYEAIPEQTRERVKDLLLDALGCALAGHQGEETPQVSALARALGASEESSVIGGEGLSLAGATLLNAYLVTAITACDVYRPALSHMTPEVVPPALAVAERDGLDGQQLLTALAAGLEVATRVSVGLHYPSFRARGWHSPGVVGPFGGAAAVGKLLGLDEARQRNALGLAGSQSAGTFAAWGTPTVKFHQCRGALAGLMAGLLAEQGFQASNEILTHPDGGLFNTYSDGGRPEAMLAELGERWELEHISLRLWPTASAIQIIITALFELIERQDLRAADVERVRVLVGPHVHQQHGCFANPSGTFDALLSAHFVTAVVLREREAWLEQFGPSRYNDPELRQFIRERIEVEADPNLPETSCRIEVRTREGKEVAVRADVPKGDPQNPLSRAELTKKFRQCAAGVLSASAVERVLEIVLGLETVSDVGDLTGLLRRTAP